MTQQRRCYERETQKFPSCGRVSEKMMQWTQPKTINIVCIDGKFVEMNKVIKKIVKLNKTICYPKYDIIV